MTTLFLLIEFIADPTVSNHDDYPTVRGIGHTLEETISILVQYRLCVDEEHVDANWQIEEIPVGVPVFAKNSHGKNFAVEGAVAMYDTNGTLVRTDTPAEGEE